MLLYSDAHVLHIIIFWPIANGSFINLSDKCLNLCPEMMIRYA